MVSTNRRASVLMVLVTLVAGFWVIPALAATTIFLDPNYGLANQQAQEAAFLSAVGETAIVDFDDRPAGVVTGMEWASSGLIFSFCIMCKKGSGSGLRIPNWNDQ